MPGLVRLRYDDDSPLDVDEEEDREGALSSEETVSARGRVDPRRPRAETVARIAIFCIVVSMRVIYRFKDALNESGCADAQRRCTERVTQKNRRYNEVAGRA